MSVWCKKRKKKEAIRENWYIKLYFYIYTVLPLFMRYGYKFTTIDGFQNFYLF